MTTPRPDPIATERAALVAAEKTVSAAHSALVLAALRAARGNRTRAALLVPSSVRAVSLWIDEYGLLPELDRLAKAEGWDAGLDPAARSARGYRALREEARRSTRKVRKNVPT